ncbi:MAG TPA: condensation domain-containing protein [Candidatus Dormibacteraeota bacterium]|nr:condensation domain-containing protein [Candidatus Dormibacteraeota bacterium]
MGTFPLSPSQEIVWLHEELFPDSRAYSFTAVLELTGALDEACLELSLAALVERHAAFRLELVEGGAVPVQRVRPACPPRLTRATLPDGPEGAARWERLLREHHEAPFTLTEAPLVRWCLVALPDGSHRLVHTEHHLVHDGRSYGLLVRDLFTLYAALLEGRPVELPTAGSYEDYVRLVDGAEWRERRRRSVDWWRRELEGAPLGPLPGLARETGRPGAELAGGQVRQHVEPDLTARLAAAARGNGHTLFSTMLCLFAELVRRLVGRDHLVLGTAVGNRPTGFEETVGMFVNTIPLHLRIDGRLPAVDVVDEVTDVLLRALPRQDAPILELTRALGMHSANGVDNPLFSVMFSAHDAPMPLVTVPGLDVTMVEGYNSGTSRFDIDAVLFPDSRRTVGPRTGPPGMTVVWDHAAGVFDPGELEEVCAFYQELAAAYADRPAHPLGRLATGAG